MPYSGSRSVSVVAMKFTLRFLVFACVAALCLATGCRDSISQESKEGRFNIFDPKQSNIPRKDVPRPESERERRILQGIQEGGSTDARKDGIVNALWHLIPFLAVVAVMIAGLFYWQAWQQKRAEWKVNDPMALVKELNIVHQLSEPEKRLMQELSKKNALTSPLELFVEPKYLLTAWDDDSLKSSRSSVHSLLSRLFDIAADGGTAAVSETNSGIMVYSPEIRQEGE